MPPNPNPIQAATTVTQGEVGRERFAPSDEIFHAGVARGRHGRCPIARISRDFLQPLGSPVRGVQWLSSRVETADRDADPRHQGCTQDRHDRCTRTKTTHRAAASGQHRESPGRRRAAPSSLIHQFNKYGVHCFGTVGPSRRPADDDQSWRNTRNCMASMPWLRMGTAAPEPRH